jgi:hypothetical protein
VFETLCTKTMKLKCECGNIEVEWDSKLSPLVARQCSCEYCTKQDCHYISDPISTVIYKVLKESLLKIVTHDTNTAKFIECNNCGLVLVTSKIDNDVYSVLNAKVLGITSYTVNPAIKIFNNESVSEKLSRRKKSWCKTEVRT